MPEKIIHFTLGPVQSFVAQARRTRDLWSGSFLLSYLSAQAMYVMIEAGAAIAFPSVQKGDEITDELLKAVFDAANERVIKEPTPKIGTIPNRFKAVCPESWTLEECLSVAANASVEVKKNWLTIANAVWEYYLKDIAAQGNNTAGIWDRQIKSFWDINYVVGEANDGSDGAWLDLRKNWRTHQLAFEGGDHCSLMGSSFQELSGYIRSKPENIQDQAASDGQKSVKHRKKQDCFWKAVRDKNNLSKLDFSDNERLCAIALIKRLFPLATKRNPDLIGWELDVRSWPSTTYLAAVDWIAEVHRHSEDAEIEADNYADFIRAGKNRERINNGAVFGEYTTDLSCLNSIKQFAKLDGSLYFKDNIANVNTIEINDKEHPELRQNIIDQLYALEQLVGSSPSPYFAVLLMDGDKLGALLQDSKIDTKLVSSSLDVFSQKVQDIVYEHCGVTVYAGGDDVLALLPLGSAVQAAEALRVHYLNAFAETFSAEGHTSPSAATLSGAIVFANNRMTLRAALEEAHHMLDEVAKDQNGRDSLAISVLTGGGRKLSWVSSWEVKESKTLISTTLNELVERFTQDYSSQFFYNLRERFGALLEGGKLIPDLDPQKLLVAEYMRSREADVTREHAEARVKKLLEVCKEHSNLKGDAQALEACLKTRGEDYQAKRVAQGESFIVDGALLVRFLATKGRDL